MRRWTSSLLMGVQPAGRGSGSGVGAAITEENRGRRGRARARMDFILMVVYGLECLDLGLLLGLILKLDINTKRDTPGFILKSQLLLMSGMGR